MTDLTTRLVVLLGVCFLVWLLVWAGQHFVEVRKQRVLSAAPFTALDTAKWEETKEQVTQKGQSSPVHILAFSSDDCRQCHTLQAPVLRRVAEARGEIISITEIDAPTSPELTERYQVITVPTTVVLDAAGKAYAVNYGFANVKKLLDQVDALVEQDKIIQG